MKKKRAIFSLIKIISIYTIPSYAYPPATNLRNAAKQSHNLLARRSPLRPARRPGPQTGMAQRLSAVQNMLGLELDEAAFDLPRALTLLQDQSQLFPANHRVKGK